MSKDIFDCYNWYVNWIQWLKVMDAANHPKMHRRAPNKELIIWFKMSVMQY